ncbi:MAG: WYL domain-containing protein [Planctomyces sp.]|nr:WYL domain-containing protein [Planctomyces sp.]
MSESKSLIRQWRLLRMLADARNGYTVRELQEEMSVSLETIRRDLKDLAAGGFRVRETVGFRGVKRWRVEDFEDNFHLNITDLLSIYVGRQFLEPLAGTPFWDGQQKVFSKIRGALGEPALRYLQKLTKSLYATSIGTSDYSHRWAMIDQLMIAIEDRFVSLIAYQSDQASEAVEQEIYPQGFVFHRGSLYLVAWAVQRNAIRTYKVDRIETVQTTKLSAVIPENFDLAEWLEHSFGIFRSGSDRPLQTIRICFTREVARYVRESRWHKNQKLIPQPDGSLIADFMLIDTQEIKRWIMSFGPNATVLEPDELVEEIRRDLEQMKRTYECRPQHKHS